MWSTCTPTSRTPNQIYMLLIIVLILSQDASFNANIHKLVIKDVPWYKVGPPCRCKLEPGSTPRLHPGSTPGLESAPPGFKISKPDE